MLLSPGASTSLVGGHGTPDFELCRGNLTDMSSGNLVATLLPGSADTGIISNSGIFFPEATLTVRWEVDQQLAHLRATGTG